MYPSSSSLERSVAILQLPITFFTLVESMECKLINETQSHASVLKHMVERKILNEV